MFLGPVLFLALQAPPQLELTVANRQLTGVLRLSVGASVAGRQIKVTATDVGARLTPSERDVGGTVPLEAVSGVLGIRSGIGGTKAAPFESGALIGAIGYKEEGSPLRTFSPVRVPIPGAPVSVKSILTGPNQRLVDNIAGFPVTGGAHFTLNVAMASTPAATNAGYVTVIFLNRDKREVSRSKILFSPTVLDFGTIRTDSRGRFHLPIPESVSNADLVFTAKYQGDWTQQALMGSAGSELKFNNHFLSALERTLPVGQTPLTVLYPRADYRSIFTNPAGAGQIQAEWDQVAPQVQMAFFAEHAIDDMPAGPLAAMVANLRAKHIGLGLEILATNWYHEPPGGNGLEGFSDPGSANRTVGKLLRAGAVVDEIAMDEPLWFAHYYSGPNQLQCTIDQLAGRVAVIDRIFTAAFPNIAICDTEPFPAVSSQAGWQADYGRWCRAFEKAVGKPLTAGHLDFDWGNPLLNMGPSGQTPNPAAIALLARRCAGVMRSHDMRVGMIFNGGGYPTATTDAGWMGQTRFHIRALSVAGLGFDRAVVDSWDKYPAATFPESDPNALSSLIPAARATLVHAARLAGGHQSGAAQTFRSDAQRSRPSMGL